jgi:hypothetical protein
MSGAIVTALLSTTCSKHIFAFWLFAILIASASPRFEVGLPSTGTKIRLAIGLDPFLFQGLRSDESLKRYQRRQAGT